MVVSIIALLVSILLPALSKAREAAKLVVCTTNLHTFGLGMVMYSGDNNDNWPAMLVPHRMPLEHWTHNQMNSRWAWTNPQGQTMPAGWVGLGLLYDYLDEKHVYFCPSDKVENREKCEDSDWTVPASDRIVFAASYCVRGRGQFGGSSNISLDKAGKLGNVSQNPIVSCMFLYTNNPDTYEYAGYCWGFHKGGSYGYRYPVLYGGGDCSVKEGHSLLFSDYNILATPRWQGQVWRDFEAQGR